jgi:uncharacterized damage-inducible protein DinB
VLLSEVRLLFGYDRWATRRILNAATGTTADDWSRPEAVGERGLGGILVHALGAHQRWRSAWQDHADKPRPELEPLLTPVDLRTRWEGEWTALDDRLDGLEGEAPNRVWDGAPLWQTMVHVVNHGTQHRSEAAALLTAGSHSPGELDFIDYCSELSPE